MTTYTSSHLNQILSLTQQLLVSCDKLSDPKKVPKRIAALNVVFREDMKLELQSACHRWIHLVPRWTELIIDVFCCIRIQDVQLWNGVTHEDDPRLYYQPVLDLQTTSSSTIAITTSTTSSPTTSTPCKTNSPCQKKVIPEMPEPQWHRDYVLAKKSRALFITTIKDGLIRRANSVQLQRSIRFFLTQRGCLLYPKHFQTLLVREEQHIKDLFVTWRTNRQLAQNFFMNHVHRLLLRRAYCVNIVLQAREHISRRAKTQWMQQLSLCEHTRWNKVHVWNWRHEKILECIEHKAYSLRVCRGPPTISESRTTYLRECAKEVSTKLMQQHAKEERRKQRTQLKKNKREAKRKGRTPEQKQEFHSPQPEEGVIHPPQVEAKTTITCGKTVASKDMVAIMTLDTPPEEDVQAMNRVQNTEFINKMRLTELNNWFFGANTKKAAQVRIFFQRRRIVSEPDEKEDVAYQRFLDAGPADMLINHISLSHEDFTMLDVQNYLANHPAQQAANLATTLQTCQKTQLLYLRMTRCLLSKLCCVFQAVMTHLRRIENAYAEISRCYLKALHAVSHRQVFVSDVGFTTPDKQALLAYCSILEKIETIHQFRRWVGESHAVKPFAGVWPLIKEIPRVSLKFRCLLSSFPEPMLSRLYPSTPSAKKKLFDIPEDASIQFRALHFKLQFVCMMDADTITDATSSWLKIEHTKTNLLTYCNFYQCCKIKWHKLSQQEHPPMNVCFTYEDDPTTH